MKISNSRRRAKNAFSTLAVFAILLLALASTASAQSPYFPNTTAAYYSPYGQGAYGRYGVMSRQPYAFRQMSPGLLNPLSGAQFRYQSQNSGYNGNSYIQNNGAGAYFNPLGY